MIQVQVKDLMSQLGNTTNRDTLLDTVAHYMRENKLSSMIVLDDQQQEPIGIITERDLVRILCDVLDNPNANEVKVGDVMSSPPVIIEEDASLFDALVLTQARKIRHLPVVDKAGRLKGMLTYTDLAHAHLHIIELQREMIENAVEQKTQQLQAANKQLHEVNAQLKELSLEDGLLEIGNRRSMEVDLAYTHSTALRYRRPYTVVLFDVDCFKQYNDFYGHAKGDEALKKVARLLSSSIRSADRLYRYGGEELLLILPETDIAGGQILASRLVKDLADLKIKHQKSEYQILTMSGGIGGLNIDDAKRSTWKDLVNQADKNLYHAKRNGRNRVFCQGDLLSLSA